MMVRAFDEGGGRGVLVLVPWGRWDVYVRIQVIWIRWIGYNSV